MSYLRVFALSAVLSALILTMWACASAAPVMEVWASGVWPAGHTPIETARVMRAVCDARAAGEPEGLILAGVADATDDVPAARKFVAIAGRWCR